VRYFEPQRSALSQGSLEADSLSAIAVQFEKQFPIDAGAGVHRDVLGEHMGRIHIGEYCSGFGHHDFVVT
jgi:hypothetical protein